jgi:transposase
MNIRATATRAFPSPFCCSLRRKTRPKTASRRPAWMALLIGYFEGLDAERAIAWRAADSFALREFLGLVLSEAPPDHSTISRTRRLIDLETHEAGFTWMLQRLADTGLVKGKTVGIDATTLEVNAALRSIVRRDSSGWLMIGVLISGGTACPVDAADRRIPHRSG